MDSEMKRPFLILAVLVGAVCLAFQGFSPAASGDVEIVRDQWGVPHVFAATGEGGFFGVGYAAAEDRIVQMDLFRRRARGRLAEVYGADLVESDRQFRVAGISQYCDGVVENLPEDALGYLRAYAAGVNAFLRENPETVRRRFEALGVEPAAWTEGDCVCAWMAVGSLFDRLTNSGPIKRYHDFRDRVREIGEEAALRETGMMIDDWAAVVPESEMAKDTEVYEKLKATPPTPGQWFRSIDDDLLKFSHAWAVDGTRSETGKPLLESDPQTPVNNPPLWWEFHLSAGAFNVRGIGVAGSPGMLIGFNRRLAWGVSALGAGSTVTFIEKPSADGRGYLYRGKPFPFESRREVIRIKGAEPVEFEVRRTQHGFVFHPRGQYQREGEVYVSHYTQMEDGKTTLLAMLRMMAASGWNEFRDAMREWYSPGVHLVYADVEGNLGYQTLVYAPLTKRTRRMALEGWTGEDEVLGRIPFPEMPHLLNPDSHFVSHANNLPVGSWYPYDLGVGTGGTGHSSRSFRLIQLLSGDRAFSVESFEAGVHRDDVQANVAALFPVARRIAQETGAGRDVQNLLEQLRDWDLRYRADQPAYPAAMALASAALTPYRRSPLTDRLGGGGGGISHLARLVGDQFGDTDATPADPDVRDYLMAWLQQAAEKLREGRVAPAPVDGQSRDVLSMPYQQNGPMKLPVLEPRHDLTSPPLTCGQGGTIWAQKGNSYTQIVDLADIDSSRAVLPPGISEDPESPHHADQMSIWVAGATRPAPLSRARIEASATSSRGLTAEPYDSVTPRLLTMDGTGAALAAAFIQRVREDGSQSFEIVAAFDETLAAWVAVPIDMGPDTDRVYLALHGYGIRAGASRSGVEAAVGGVAAKVAYAGPQGFYEGLDQVNIPLPRSLAGAGNVGIRLKVDGILTNVVRVVIQ